MKFSNPPAVNFMHFNTAQVKFIPEVIDYKGVAAEGKDLGGGRGREDHRSQEDDCQYFPFFSSFFTAFPEIREKEMSQV